jgi:hypothetical protein
VEEDFWLIDDSVRLSILGESELVRPVDEEALSFTLLALVNLEKLDE